MRRDATWLGWCSSHAGDRIMVLDAAISRSTRPTRAARLAAFSRVFTSDVDEAAESIGRIFCPHALDPLQRSWPDFHARHNCAAFNGFSVNYVSYGGSVAIDPGCLDRFFLLQIPLQGGARIETGGRTIQVSAGRSGSLLSPTIPTQMVWHDDCAKLILLVERRLVEERAAALAEKPWAAIEFDPQIDLNTPFGLALRSQIEYLVDLAEHCGPGRQLSPMITATLRDSIIGLLLTGQRHTLTDNIDRIPARLSPLPSVLRKARDYLEAHAAEPLDLDRLACAAGIGIRSLQIGFQKHFGMSISDALRDIRLSLLNARLLRAAPGERVIDMAFDIGFSHPSRMAGVYRSRYGESPSETLRRSR
jgi:AraC-like DNA-binding protein